MTKFSRPRSWVEHRLADELAIEGASYVVELVARRGTASAGYRVTVVFMPLGAGREEVQAELAPAATTTDVHQRVRELAGNEERLRALFHGSAGGAGGQGGGGVGVGGA